MSRRLTTEPFQMEKMELNFTIKVTVTLSVIKKMKHSIDFFPLLTTLFPPISLPNNSLTQEKI